MYPDLKSKVVLITGGAKRVGAAISRRLHAAGASLMLHYRSSAGEARLLQSELNGVRADSVALVQADLLDLAPETDGSILRARRHDRASADHCGQSRFARRATPAGPHDRSIAPRVVARHAKKAVSTPV